MSGTGDAAARTVRARGRGRASLPAHGMADAEHQVEKEVLRAWPESRVEVLEVARAEEEGGRIVQEFAVAYQVDATVRLDAATSDEARREALRRLRAAFGETRHRRIEWVRVEVE